MRRIIAFFAEREKRGCDFACKKCGGCQLRFCAAYFSSFTIRGIFCRRSGDFGETSANLVSVICRKVSESVGGVADDFRRFPTLFQRDNFYFPRVYTSFSSTYEGSSMISEISSVHTSRLNIAMSQPRFLSSVRRSIMPPFRGVWRPHLGAGAFYPRDQGCFTRRSRGVLPLGAETRCP